MSCSDVQTIKAGDGSTLTFSFDFPYIFKSEIHVYFWNATTKEYDEILEDGLLSDDTYWNGGSTAYPWSVTDANPTIVTFTTAPPAPAAAVDPGESVVDNIKIRRITNVDDIRALFNPGSAIRSEDLNKNFEQLRYAIQESNCQGIPDDVDEYLKNYYWDRFDNTVYQADAWNSSDSKIASTAAIEKEIDRVITEDITTDGTGITITDGAGTIELGLGVGSIDFDRIKDADIINTSEQQGGSLSPADDNIFTAQASATRHDTTVSTAEPGTGSPTSASGTYQTGKFHFQNDDDKTLWVWNGGTWEGVTSGGTFARLEKVIYVDSINGNDSNNGHRISSPKKTIKAAINDINNDSVHGDGSVVLVSPGVYQEAAPIDIQRRDVAIIGASVRNVIVHPTPATETESLFRVNSGTYLNAMTFTGMKASGTRGETNSLWEDSTYGLPATQGWNVSFYPNAMIYKSPYIQNCTNFSDSGIDNDDTVFDFYEGTEEKGRAGDLTSGMTGGGLLINGDTPHVDSPLRSIVCDSYTHTGLDAPGIFVTNNGYCQATSSYAFFNHFHIACLNGGQANLAASTSDFGRFSLIADGRSTTAIFTATTTAAASESDLTFTINAPTAAASWHGSENRPQDNMLVDIGGNTYPVLSAVANGTGWDVTISRPNTNDRTENLGLAGAVSSGAAVSFYLRSMIASSGHTMEYVGSGTDYRALPENGGVPDDTKQITELNNGKIWAATTDHQGTFKVGETFSVNQQTGFVDIAPGALSLGVLLTDLNTNAKKIISGAGTNDNITLDPDGSGSVDVSTAKITSVGTPTNNTDAATKGYVDGFIQTDGSSNASTNDTSFFTTQASDTRYFRQDSTETITSGVTWSGDDAHVATTGAIDNRIVDLLDDIGGFVPIADETSFPTTNPDTDNGEGTIVSIVALSTNYTPPSSGANQGKVTFTNGPVGDQFTVTVQGIPANLQVTNGLPQDFGVLVATTTTLHTYDFHRLVPKATEVSVVAANSSDVNTVAGVAANVTTVAGISADVTTVANDGTDIGTVATNITNVNTVAGINSNVTTVAGISADVTNVANDATDIGTVATNITNVNTVAGISTDVTTVANDQTDIGTVATNISNVNTVAGISANVTTVANDGTDIGTVATNIANVNTVAGINANVTTVAGISTDVTAVANDATDIGTVAGKATEIGRLGTADAVADMNTLGTADVVSDMNTLATTANVNNMSTCATDISNVNTVAGSIANVNTAANSITNVNTVATNIANVNLTGGSIANVNTTAGSITNVNTVATNISSVNDFAARYRVSLSEPTTSLNDGDLWWDSTNDVLKIYDATGSAWVESTQIATIPQNSQTSAYILASTDVGKHVNITTGGVTVPVTSGNFSIGDAISIFNDSISDQTITAATNVTLYSAGTADTGNRTLAQRGLCTVLCVGTNEYVITGAGLS